MKSNELIKLCEESSETYKDYLENIEPVLLEFSDSSIFVTDSRGSISSVSFTPKKQYINDIKGMTEKIMEKINQPFSDPYSDDLYELMNDEFNSSRYEKGMGDSYFIRIRNRDFQFQDIN